MIEHWESLAAAVPDIWERFGHSPIIATELAKAGKSAHALSQTHVFENAIRTGKQLQVEQVRALIALHGRSTLLRDLFSGRLQFMAGQNSMAGLERAAYAAMASYLAENFRGDEAVGQVMLSLAKSSYDSRRCLHCTLSRMARCAADRGGCSEFAGARRR